MTEAPAKPLTLDDLFPTTNHAQEWVMQTVNALVTDSDISATAAVNAMAGATCSLIANRDDRLQIVADVVKRMVQGVAAIHIALTGATPVQGDAPANSNTPQARDAALLTIHNRANADGWLRILVDGTVEHGSAITLNEAAAQFFAAVSEHVRNQPMLVLAVDSGGELHTQAAGMAMLARLGYTLMRVEERAEFEILRNGAAAPKGDEKKPVDGNPGSLLSLPH